MFEGMSPLLESINQNIVLRTAPSNMTKRIFSTTSASRNVPRDEGINLINIKCLAAGHPLDHPRKLTNSIVLNMTGPKLLALLR